MRPPLAALRWGKGWEGRGGWELNNNISEACFHSSLQYHLYMQISTSCNQQSLLLMSVNHRKSVFPCRAFNLNATMQYPSGSHHSMSITSPSNQAFLYMDETHCYRTHFANLDKSQDSNFHQGEINKPNCDTKSLIPSGFHTQTLLHSIEIRCFEYLQTLFIAQDERVLILAPWRNCVACIAIKIFMAPWSNEPNWIKNAKEGKHTENTQCYPTYSGVTKYRTFCNMLKGLQIQVSRHGFQPRPATAGSRWTAWERQREFQNDARLWWKWKSKRNTKHHWHDLFIRSQVSRNQNPLGKHLAFLPEQHIIN